MALSNQELQDRVIALEKQLTNVQVAITNLATKKQLEQLNFINQRNITDLQDRLAIVEADIASIKSQI